MSHNDRGLWRDTAGVIGPVMALAAVPIFGMVGVAIDHGRLSQSSLDVRGIVQEACDRSNSVYFANSPIGDRLDAAQSVLTIRSANADGLGDVAFAAQTVGTQIAVTANGSIDATLAGVLGLDTIDVNIAMDCGPQRMMPPGQMCFMALDMAMKRALHVHDGTFDAPGCDLHVRSFHKEAAVIHEKSVLTVNSVCVGGQAVTNALVDEVVDNGLSGDIQGLVQNACTTVADPLAGKPERVAGGCDYSNFEVTRPGPPLRPGVYCGGILVRSGVSANLRPGEYVIAGGDLILEPGSALTGQEVTIILDNADSSMDMKSAMLNISAANTGPYAGIALFQHATGPSITVDLELSSNITIDGTVYLPGAELNLNDSTLNAAAGGHLRVIVNDFDVKKSLVTLRPNSDTTATVAAY